MPMKMQIKIKLFPVSRCLYGCLFAVAFLSCAVLAGCARDAARVPEPSRSPDPVPVSRDTGLEPTLKPYRINGVRYYPVPDSEGFVEYGNLSWYGGKFHGRPTASGETYDMYKKSAAHKTLPMGTWVRVVNLANNCETVVRINDRGPFVKGRILDLSYASAKELGLTGLGVAPGKIIALAPEVDEGRCVSEEAPVVVNVPSLRKGVFCVQVGAFSSRDSALGIAEKLKGFFENVTVTRHVIDAGGIVHRVRVSRSKTLTEAEEVEKRLTSMGFSDAFVVRL